MKKTVLSLICMSSCLSASQGSLIRLMQETNDALPIPSTADIASAALVVGASTVGGVLASQKAGASRAQTRTADAAPTVITPAAAAPTVTINASSLSSSPYTWFAVGVVASLFAIYHFIGHEMGIIIETKATLNSLSKDIEKWQRDLPKFREDQEAMKVKVDNAVAILDSIAPLVTKLVKNPETSATVQVAAIQKELADLKALVKKLPGAQNQAAFQAVEKQSTSLFGFGKRVKLKRNPHRQAVAKSLRSATL